MLNKITAVKIIEVDADIGACYFSSLPLDKLVMKFATETIQTDMWNLAVKTRCIELLETQMTAKDIRTFISAWLSGSDLTDSEASGASEAKFLEDSDTSTSFGASITNF